VVAVLAAAGWGAVTADLLWALFAGLIVLALRWAGWFAGKLPTPLATRAIRDLPASAFGRLLAKGC
jgi:hypothetical protein